MWFVNFDVSTLMRFRLTETHVFDEVSSISSKQNNRKPTTMKTKIFEKGYKM